MPGEAMPDLLVKALEWAGLIGAIALGVVLGNVVWYAALAMLTP